MIVEVGGAVVPIVEIIVGSGVIAMLWKMNNQLGSLTEQIKNFSSVLTDHETRIRDLEKDK